MRVLSFQPREDILTLLKEGELVRRTTNRCKDQHFKSRKGPAPIYSYYYMFDRRFQFLSIIPMTSYWAQFMGYMRLDGRDIIEMEIPEDEGELWYVDKKDKYSSGDPFDDSIELVTYRLLRKWVVAVYEKSKEFSDYYKVTIYPRIFNPDLKPLMEVPFIVAGNCEGSREIFSKLPFNLREAISVREASFLSNKLLVDRLLTLDGITEDSVITKDLIFSLLSSYGISSQNTDGDVDLHIKSIEEAVNSFPILRYSSLDSLPEGVQSSIRFSLIKSNKL